MEFSRIYISAQACVPNFHDVIKEMLDLQRDLHANDFALCEEYAFGTRTLLLDFSFFVKKFRSGVLKNSVKELNLTEEIP